MLDQEQLETLSERLYRAYDLLDSYEALNCDNVVEFKKPDDLYDTLCDLDEALDNLKDARLIVVKLMGGE